MTGIYFRLNKYLNDFYFHSTLFFNLGKLVIALLFRSHLILVKKIVVPSIT